MAKILVKKEDRYEIFYDPKQRKFSAEVGGDEVAVGTTQEYVEEYVKKLAKRQFKRIPAIWHRYRDVARVEITSMITSSPDTLGYPRRPDVWIVIEGEGRQKTRLEGLYQQTDKNLALLTEIEHKRGEVRVLENLIVDLIKSLEATITEENILVLAGVEKEKRQGESK